MRRVFLESTELQRIRTLQLNSINILCYLPASATSTSTSVSSTSLTTTVETAAAKLRSGQVRSSSHTTIMAYYSQIILMSSQQFH